MKYAPGSGFLSQFIALVIAVVLVHSVYVAVVWPRAEALVQEQQARQAAGEAAELRRSLYIVVKDFEQEVCFILGLWAAAIIGLKLRQVWAERRLGQHPLVEVNIGTRILPEDARLYARPLQALPPREREFLLPRALQTALQRFGTTCSIQAASTAIREICETEAERLDSELAMLRYIIWAIPSIGFIGTVRGIGEALGQAQRAVEGDIVGVTMSLGVAFNSTFIALVISIFIMFLMHQLQLLQERLVFDIQSYCEANLIQHLQVR